MLFKITHVASVTLGMQQCPSGILYTSADDSIFLIDLPVSIEIGNSQSKRLASSSAETGSLQPPEPKTVSARNKVLKQISNQSLLDHYSLICTEALSRLKASLSSPQTFCIPRFILLNRTSALEDLLQSADALSLHTDHSSAREQEQEDENSQFVNNGRKHPVVDKLSAVLRDVACQKSPAAALTSWTWQNEQTEERDWFIDNTQNATRKLSLSVDGRTLSFNIPPLSKLLLRECQFVSEFRAAAKAATSMESRGKFDLILLDPPWPNRSAKRRGSYDTNLGVPAIKKTILRLDLDQHIVPGGFVAMWITNSGACRDAVLGPGGLFKQWNLQLIEEWVWLKITTNGEPLYPIDYLWRKPFEVLLIGQAPLNRFQMAMQTLNVTTRVIVGVPDFHSRKPCLKPLFERLLLQRTQNYSALEVFARYLTTGWFGWGNEALLYNWEGFWSSAVES